MFNMRIDEKKNHSRKVPDSYKIAARICKDVSENHCNVKSLIFSGKYRHVVRQLSITCVPFNVGNSYNKL